MSDISFRFDGLALLATLVLSALGYFLIALIAMIRHWPQIARLAAIMGAVTTVLTAVFFSYWANQGTYSKGLEYIDGLIIPWGIVFLASCWRLSKSGNR